ncbi:HugZ family pyridoxamine 5'-phosphate oxidase [Noviherbaspirillum autotrophicum]|uniref:Pyridoxamine 5'-phosphate oxidase n=1 Tax=Noviherbaspirillum autotrophicum TaxID=709839 RepID=A0A0C2BVS3_9BURK|nr:pyridoxamine 5'-phosphate oxidase family protein [Noviherbaspirillum autotrophicum]KIF82126.1 pyridoxamine 5'-phosphate oxidase [Noviherbaspirillum autotrophicum]
MKPSLTTALHLLHGASSGALATHSTQLPDYPFASALPFVPDQGHRPVFLLSGLAEHTKNLIADPRASLLVTGTDAQNVLTGPRMTIMGDVIRVDPTPELAARYVRYQPDAQQYLELGDFAFFRLQPKRTRYIGGFAQMGWIEDAEWPQAAAFPWADEAALLARFEHALPAGARLLGIDCYGADLERDGRRLRLPFPDTCRSTEEIASRMESMRLHTV